MPDDSQDSSYQKIKSIFEEIGVLITTVGICVFILNLLMGRSLSQLFTQLMWLQLAVFQIGFHLLYPKNFVEVSQMFVKLAKFDILPSSEFFESICSFAELEQALINPRFGRLLGNLKSYSFALNSGSVLMMMQIYLLLLAIAGILSLCRTTTAVRDWLKKQLMWNVFIDLLLLSQVGFLYAGLLFKRDPSSQEQLSGVTYDQVLTVCVLLIYLLSILSIIIVVLKHMRSKSLASDQFLSKFGSIFPDTRTRSVVFLAFPFVDSALRVVFVHLLLQDDATSQCFFHRIVLLFFFIFLGSTKPYILSTDQRVQVTHCLFLICHGLLMPVYTEFVLDVRARFQMGYVSITMLSAQLLLGFAVVIQATVNQLKLRIRMLYLICKKRMARP